jgi:hypothetical protein
LLKTEPLFSGIDQMKARSQGKIAAVQDISQAQMGGTGT